MEIDRRTDGEISALQEKIDALESENARLREGTERQRTVFAAIEEGFALLEVIVDGAGHPVDLRPIEVNDAFAELVGLSRQDILRHTARELLPAVAPWWIETMGKVAISGNPAYLEHHGAFTHRHYEVRAWSPKPGRCAGLFRDVTERKRAEEALRESEQRFRDLADAMPQLVWTARPDGTVDYYNRRYDDFLGISREGRSWEWIPAIHPDDVDATVAAWRRAMATGADYEVEQRVRRADGTYCWYLSRAVPARDAQGRITKWYGTATDIHGAKAAVQALRESEERFLSVLENSRDVIYRSNLRTGGYDYLSPSVKDLTGYSEGEIMAMPIAWARDRVHPEDRERYLAGIEVLAQRPPAKRSETIECRWRHRDGTYRWISNSRTLVTDADGQPVALVGTLRDVTESKAMERQLHELNETLEGRVAERTRQLRALAAELAVAEERERRRLARILHDDLQQTLAATIYHLQSLSMQARGMEDGDAIAESIAMLRGAIETSRALTAELSPTVLFDKTGLRTALHWLGRHMEQLFGLRVTVQTCARPECPQSPAVSDDVKVLLYQSVRELLFNVVKHAHADEATVSVTRPTRDTVEVVVADGGRGFEMSEHLRRVSSPNGFGLFSISERLEYVGGSARVESAPGRGTRVTLTAPLQPPPSPEGGSAREASADRPQAEEAAEGRIRIVLADDHAIVRQGLLRLLQDQPDFVIVGEAEDGLAAVELAQKLRPDVVLMDLAMPKMDGIEATRRIAAELPGVRVIGLSMYDDEEKENLMRQAGAKGYVAKGGPPDALFATIRADQGG